MKLAESRKQKPTAISAMVVACLLASFVPAPSVLAAEGLPVLAKYSGAETGMHTLAYDVAQDRDGVLYFAGTSLLIFDGDRWTAVKMPDAYSILRLRFGSDGKLWAGGVGELGWFAKNADDVWVYHSLRDKLPAAHTNLEQVWGVCPDSNGTTFVTRNAILRWNGESFQATEMPTEFKLYSTWSNSGFFIHHMEGGLYWHREGHLELLVPPNLLVDRAVMWAERGQSGWLLGASDGLFTFDGRKLTPFAPDIAAFFKKERLTSVRRLPDGRLAVGTLRGGIVFLHPDGRVDSQLGVKQGLPSLYTTSLLVSRDNELWATTGSHIVRVDITRSSTRFDESLGLPAQTYRKITKAGDTMYVANESGVYELTPESSGFRQVESESLSGRWDHLRGTNDALFLSRFREARQWSNGEAKPLLQSGNDIYFTAPSRTDPKVTLVAESTNIVAVDSAGNSRALVRSLPYVPTSLAQDTLGALWLGTLARGVLFAPAADSNAPTQARQASGLPAIAGQTHVRATTDGSIVVISNQGAWHKSPSAERFDPVRDFPVRPVASVSEVASNDSIWVVHENTAAIAPVIGRIWFEGTVAVWKPHAIDALLEVGSPRTIYADASKPDETVLWIGGTHATLRHTIVGGALRNPEPRAPLLRAFARHPGSVARQQFVNPLPYDVESVEFEFAAPEYSRRSLLRIETRISGLDSDWTPVGPGSRRELTAIRDGRYTLQARVVAETGAVSSEASLDFQVLPPWWRTPPMLLGWILATAPLAFGIYNLRVRRLRQHNAELETKVRQRTEELEAASAAKTQFVANMSHDIRNPLNGIVGLSLALEDTRLDKRQREIVATLRECTTYLSSLVDDVLDFASIEAGRVELRPGPYVPHELLRSIVETLKADTTERSALLLVEADPSIPRNVLGDAGRVQQILVNFASNALKYAGGHIRLSVMVPANSPGELEFSVADEGPGISAAEQATLFTKFTRLSRVSGKDIPGAGLGLAACRLLADIMGGSVGIESAIGQGARFFLRLPLTIADAPTEVPLATLPNTTVLLVEDTDYNAWAAEAVLSKLGLTCERARTGAEAVRLFSEKRYNVVLLDRNLPDMDGTEVARQMRAVESDGLQSILLAVTAYCTAEDRALCLQAGMDAFVGKPLTPEKLRKVLHSAARRLLATGTAQMVDPTPASNTIDFTLLKYLSDGTPEGIEAQVQRFLETLEQAERDVSEAARDLDDFRLAEASHRVVGQARMVSAQSLIDVSNKLETCARTQGASSCTSQISRMKSEIRNLREAMRRRRSAAPSR